jgi:hypothetical protein
MLTLPLPITTNIIGGKRERQVMTTFVEGMRIKGALLAHPQPITTNIIGGKREKANNDDICRRNK